MDNLSKTFETPGYTFGFVGRTDVETLYAGLDLVGVVYTGNTRFFPSNTLYISNKTLWYPSLDVFTNLTGK